MTEAPGFLRPLPEPKELVGQVPGSAREGLGSGGHGGSEQLNTREDGLPVRRCPTQTHVRQPAPRRCVRCVSTFISSKRLFTATFICHISSFPSRGLFLNPRFLSQHCFFERCPTRDLLFKSPHRPLSPLAGAPVRGPVSADTRYRPVSTPQPCPSAVRVKGSSHVSERDRTQRIQVGRSLNANGSSRVLIRQLQHRRFRGLRSPWGPMRRTPLESG